VLVPILCWCSCWLRRYVAAGGGVVAGGVDMRRYDAADAGSVDAGRVNTYVAAGLLVSSSAGLVVVDRVRC
jgi:hypothetical protein